MSLKASSPLHARQLRQNSTFLLLKKLAILGRANGYQLSLLRTRIEIELACRRAEQQRKARLKTGGEG